MSTKESTRPTGPTTSFLGICPRCGAPGSGPVPHRWQFVYGVCDACEVRWLLDLSQHEAEKQNKARMRYASVEQALAGRKRR